MPVKPTRINIKNRFEFALGPRFEFFFALQALTDKNFRVHRQWRQRALAKMPPAFGKEFQTLGACPAIWPIVADALKLLPVSAGFESVVAELKKQDIRDFQREVLCGAIHYRDIADNLLQTKLTLAEALAAVPDVKREWLAFIGLYPYQQDRDMVVAMELLLREPERFRRAVIHLLDLFWKHSFKNDWLLLKPQLQKSLEEKKRLFDSGAFAEFAKKTLLRIEVDEKRQTINAVRGGYRLPFEKIAKGYIFPSAFNDKRYWTTSEKNGGETVFFPYFEPALSVGLVFTPSEKDAAAPELDPYLIFKALGDPTRAAIASIIARSPASSVSIADTLKLSKPLVSHHVHVLREAGVLSEMRANGCVFLSLDKTVLEDLSRLAVNRFFGNQKNKEAA
ncbi:MAG: helix-turn-helix domain-containing protein [Elusimicrobiales bacterium]|nr:helix-turn-helix domain-containing protein [Elusimicrobiales bacterium]